MVVKPIHLSYTNSFGIDRNFIVSECNKVNAWLPVIKNTLNKFGFPIDDIKKCDYDSDLEITFGKLSITGEIDLKFYLYHDNTPIYGSIDPLRVISYAEKKFGRPRKLASN